MAIKVYQYGDGNRVLVEANGIVLDINVPDERDVLVETYATESKVERVDLERGKYGQPLKRGEAQTFRLAD